MNVHSLRLQWAVKCGENLISFHLKVFVEVLGILKTNARIVQSNIFENAK